MLEPQAVLTSPFWSLPPLALRPLDVVHATLDLRDTGHFIIKRHEDVAERGLVHVQCQVAVPCIAGPGSRSPPASFLEPQRLLSSCYLGDGFFMSQGDNSSVMRSGL